MTRDAPDDCFCDLQDVQLIFPQTQLQFRLANLPRVLSLIFFFSSRRRHTRSKRDWSSDVCSSDLARPNFLQMCDPISIARFERRAVRPRSERCLSDRTFAGSLGAPKLFWTGLVLSGQYSRHTLSPFAQACRASRTRDSCIGGETPARFLRSHRCAFPPDPGA